jgi:DNA-binding CsgD family transcriptional regulator
MGSDLTHRLLNDVRDALASSLDLRQATIAAEPFLRRLVAADYIAVGSTLPHAPTEFEWIVADMPRDFFASYPEMAAHDFVLRAVMAAPNQALRDSEMLPRRELERNMMYGRSRDIGTPLEHVMSAMLHVDGEWASGISLFRSTSQPFSEPDRLLLQSILPALRNTVRNCRTFGQAASRADTFESILARDGRAVLLLAPPATEITRSESTTPLLERWFLRAETRKGLPESILDWTRELTTRSLANPADTRVLAQRSDGQLVAKAYWVEHVGHRCLALVLHESRLRPELPERWIARLTPREIEIATKVVDGHTNDEIATLLAISEQTVKKHIYNVFQKLGIEHRAQLIATARRLT